jgi:hypothetical protein
MKTLLFSLCIALVSPLVLAQQLDGIYKTQRDRTEIVPKAVRLGNKWVELTDGTSFALDKDEPVAVEHRKDGDVLVHILVAEEDAASTPDTLLLSEDQFIDGDFQFVKQGDERTLANEYSAYLPTDIASRGNGRANARHHASGRRASYSIGGHWQAGGCLAYAERYVGWNRPGGVHGASNFASVLLSSGSGYRSVQCQRPPVGTVGSWTGKHVAVWNGSCWQYDAGCGDPGAGYGHLKLCVSRGY